MWENTGRQFQSQHTYTFVLLSTFNKRRFLALWAEKVEEKHYRHLKKIQFNYKCYHKELNCGWTVKKKKKLTDVYESSMRSRDEGGEEFCRLQCVRLWA